MHILPIFRGYTVDFRLQEFRRVSLLEPGNPDSRKLEFIPFNSPFGKKLLGDLKRKAATKFIGVWTIGMMQETSETREAVEKEFDRQVKEKDDWFYTVVVNGKKFFVAENGEFGYTAMLPDEY